ncbi:insulinase family protein [Tateyamaria omphalii]|uniref:M16 family metallopeptidase n=1 Tax=Tateyamaria omphalii TaxID=299262 RepID=UPI001C9A0C80|nr:insulinase family protein [Tateyamaria omphalii]MBY5931492.1 insulinase family protein [Tateyamaria omphalii]
MRFFWKSIPALALAIATFATAVAAQNVMPLWEKGGLHAAYVVPRDDFNRVDVQLIVLSGSYDDPALSGTAHLTEHLAAFSSDAAVLRRARERDLNAVTRSVSTVYTNSGPPEDIELLLRLSRAVLETPDLPPGFAESEIKILHRETHLRERRSPYRWLVRKALRNLYGSSYGRADNTIADLSRLNLEAAYQFHETHYVPSNVTLIVSGKIKPAKAAELVAQYFGDTASLAAPEKPWLDQKPNQTLRKIERLSSDRLSDDVVLMTKFIDFEDRDTSIDMQGDFFLATAVLQNRLANALRYEDTMLFDTSSDWFLSKVADLEVTIVAHPMPGIDLDTARNQLETTWETLLDTPIQPKELAQVRKSEMVQAENAARRPAMFLQFLQNVASDGFPPISPSVFARIISDTSDEQVIDFAKKVIEPSATSIVLAQRAR